ncbi:hypothetical protein BKI52_10010 [marine bacterium AO1-C]|nr:hypothetical protein BKI52_10010 [marine bacterium AO1-C]
MKFQDLLTNTTTKRNELKPFFNTGETPSQKNFHDLIDGLFLVQGNGLFKDDQNGLSIQTSTEDLTKTALLFYDAPDKEPEWSMSIKDGFHLKDTANNARLSVLNDGKIGVGTLTPDALLQIGDPAASVGGRHNIRLGKYVSVGESGGGLSTIVGNNIKASETEDNKSVYMNNTDPGQMIRLNYVYGLSFHTSTQAGTAGADYDELASERMRITTDGKVGVGLPNPYSTLHVHGPSLTLSSDLSDTTNVLETMGIYPFYQIAGYNGGNPTTVYEVPIKNGVRNDILFTWRNIIDGSGIILKGDTTNVGIGTLDPGTFKLRVSGGDAAFDQDRKIFFYDSDGPYSFVGNQARNLVLNSNWNGVISLRVGDQEKAFINNAGDFYVDRDVYANNVKLTSDLRYKKNVRDINTEITTRLAQLRGTTFEWRADEFQRKSFSEGTQIGFIAQELKKVYPELVSEDKDGHLSINYQGIIPILVEAVKDLNQQNQSLQSRVLHLEKLTPITPEA